MSEMQIEDRADEVANLLVRVYEIHELIITETSGLSGFREATLLHAAVARPFATFGGEELYPTDFEKAAALFHSLIKSHRLWMERNERLLRLHSSFLNG